MFPLFWVDFDADKAKSRIEIEAMLERAMRFGISIRNVDYLGHIENYKRFQSVFLGMIYDFKDRANGRNPCHMAALEAFGARYDFNRIYDRRRFEERQRRLREVESAIRDPH
jgi:hypothetical protein